jgi:hypothetical protein
MLSLSNEHRLFLLLPFVGLPSTIAKVQKLIEEILVRF